MGRGCKLTNEEYAVIKVLFEEDYSVSEIAQKVGRSFKPVYNVLKLLRSGAQRKRPGHKRKLTRTPMRAVLRKASRGLYSASRLRSMFSLSVLVRRVQQVLQKAQHLQWMKMTTAPKLSPQNRADRLALALYHLTK